MDAVIYLFYLFISEVFKKKRSFQKRDAETKKLFGGTLCKYA